MISDKMAKMAINTLKEYCKLQDDNLQNFADRLRKDEIPESLTFCTACVVKDACNQSPIPFGLLNSYNDVGTIEDLQKSTKEPIKFDLRQKYSADFRKYINEIFLREAEKYELPMNTDNSIKWFENGKIQVTFVDNDMTYVGVAKCHPDDAFNPEIGIKLAIERAAQNMRKPFTPREGQAYCYVDENGVVRGTGFLGSIESKLNVAMGNCFKTRAQAQANAGIMMKRLERATELLKTLRDEGEK